MKQHRGWADCPAARTVKKPARPLRREGRHDRFAVVVQRVRVVPELKESHPGENALLRLDDAQTGDILESEEVELLLGTGGLDESLPAHPLNRQARIDFGQPFLRPAAEGCRSVDEILIRGVEIETDSGHRVLPA